MIKRENPLSINLEIMNTQKAMFTSRLMLYELYLFREDLFTSYPSLSLQLFLNDTSKPFVRQVPEMTRVHFTNTTFFVFEFESKHRIESLRRHDLSFWYDKFLRQFSHETTAVSKPAYTIHFELLSGYQPVASLS